ncbi:hypothetical protein [Nitrosovibrio sp. Nv17]|jgi:hypothetical protein|uniref:hypothetical protein n=1 Tax=Nitrosovibrio sp. Nv17 TaxID=1855339 RepID=UPI000908A7F8|nr:hypothetical protein [Nitrosovibrio sp. Nv17]SFW39528.1 hypothetical protein SAMN05216414_1345 [Nitrosovibrio sp. Nv17]
MRVPVHNSGKLPIYVGACIVLPGETRHFDERDVPAQFLPPPPEPESIENSVPSPDPLAELLQGKVPEIVAALPALSQADLDQLGQLEQLSAAPRKGVLSAVAEEILKRAE